MSQCLARGGLHLPQRSHSLFNYSISVGSVTPILAGFGIGSFLTFPGETKHAIQYVNKVNPQTN